MKASIWIALVIALLLGQLNVGRAQWVRTNGPVGGQLLCFEVSGTELLAGTLGGGLYVSTDTGASWAARGTGLENTAVCQLRANGVSLYGGDLDGNVYFSSDDGKTWTERDNGLYPGFGVAGFALFGTEILMASGNVLMTSSNDGLNWTESWRLSGASINCLFQSDSLLLAGTTDGVYLSNDAGVNWRSAGTGIPAFTQIWSLVAQGSDFFAGSAEGWVYRSTDGGGTWSHADSGIVGPHVLSLLASTKGLLAGTDKGVFFSSDSGRSWASASAGVLDMTVSCLATLGSSVLAGTVRGVYRSTNDGIMWEPSNTGLTNTNVQDLAIRNATLLAGTQNLGVFRSTDGGANWTNTNSSIPTGTVAALAYNSSYLFAGTGRSYSERGSGVYRSSDDGQTWAMTGTGLELYSVDALATNGTTIFAGGVPGGFWPSLFRSTDSGVNWDTVSVPVYPINALAANAIQVVALSGPVYSSIDDGLTWSSHTTGSSGTGRYAVALADSIVYAGTSTGVYRSTIGDTSWLSVNNGLTNLNVRSLAISGMYIFAGTDSGVFLSSNNGEKWTSVGDGLPRNSMVSALVASNTTLYAGIWSNGAWSRPLADMIMSVRSLPSGVPAAFQLCQNYPNPFNPTTTIQFTIVSAQSGSASAKKTADRSGRNRQLTIVKVYDVLGREVATLVNEVKEPGTYTVQFDGSNLASGVYFYRLTSGSYLATHKMILMR